MKTLDSGGTSALINGVSFVSQNDWVVGQATSGNQATLSAGDVANVSAPGKGGYIGQNAGANNNKIIALGTITANMVRIGSTDGNPATCSNSDPPPHSKHP